MKTRNLFNFLILAVLILASIADAQRTSRITRPCSGTSTPASLSITTAGAISISPCSGQTVSIPASTLTTTGDFVATGAVVSPLRVDAGIFRDYDTGATFGAISSTTWAFPNIIASAPAPIYVPLTVQLFAAQTANAFEILPSGSATPLSFFRATGGLVVKDTGSLGAQIQAPGGGAFGFARLSLTNSDYSTTSTFQQQTTLDLYPASDTFNIFNGSSGAIARFDNSTTAGQTRFLIYDVDSGTLERVTVGAADSCGAGFKCLRIPN